MLRPTQDAEPVLRSSQFVFDHIQKPSLRVILYRKAHYIFTKVHIRDVCDETGKATNVALPSYKPFKTIYQIVYKTRVVYELARLSNLCTRILTPIKQAIILAIILYGRTPRLCSKTQYCISTVQPNVQNPSHPNGKAVFC